MLDYNKEEIKEKDYLIECDEDTADFWQVIDGKPQYFARWGWTSQLNLHNPEEHLKRLEALPETLDHEKFIKQFLIKRHHQMQEPDTSGMYICNPELSGLLAELQESKVKITIREDIHICQVGEN